MGADGGEYTSVSSQRLHLMLSDGRDEHKRRLKEIKGIYIKPAFAKNAKLENGKLHCLQVVNSFFLAIQVSLLSFSALSDCVLSNPSEFTELVYVLLSSHPATFCSSRLIWVLFFRTLQLSLLANWDGGATFVKRVSLVS